MLGGLGLRFLRSGFGMNIILVRAFAYFGKNVADSKFSKAYYGFFSTSVDIPKADLLGKISVSKFKQYFVHNINLIDNSNLVS